MSIFDEAPSGQIYVCSACGKTSKTKAGVYQGGAKATEQSWDASCMLNSVLCYEEKVFWSEGDVVGMVWDPVEAKGE